MRKLRRGLSARRRRRLPPYGSSSRHRQGRGRQIYHLAGRHQPGNAYKRVAPITYRFRTTRCMNVRGETRRRYHRANCSGAKHRSGGGVRVHNAVPRENNERHRNCRSRRCRGGIRNGATPSGRTNFAGTPGLNCTVISGVEGQRSRRSNYCNGAGGLSGFDLGGVNYGRTCVRRGTRRRGECECFLFRAPIFCIIF